MINQKPLLALMAVVIVSFALVADIAHLAAWLVGVIAGAVFVGIAMPLAFRLKAIQQNSPTRKR